MAAAAGVTFLGPDPDRRGYGRFRAPCGHVLQRQFELIERVAKGATGLRCETCHAEREASEARRFGWERLGHCPSGRPNYRLYRHTCGHVQRVAQANMLWGQCDCAGCGLGWNAKPSFLYLLRRVILISHIKPLTKASRKNLSINWYGRCAGGSVHRNFSTEIDIPHA